MHSHLQAEKSYVCHLWGCWVCILCCSVECTKRVYLKWAYKSFIFYICMCALRFRLTYFLLLTNIALYFEIIHCIYKYICYNHLPDDLWELVQLSGVPINREVSKIVSSILSQCCLIWSLSPTYVCVCTYKQIIELLKLNVPPAIILQMLKTLRSDITCVWQKPYSCCIYVYHNNKCNAKTWNLGFRNQKLINARGWGVLNGKIYQNFCAIW